MLGYVIFLLHSMILLQYANVTNDQLNNGESKGRYPTNPREFCTDPTQGPAEQRTTWRPAIARFYNTEFCDDLQNFKDDELFNEIFDYQYGYLTPKLHKEAQCLAWLEENIQNIYLNQEAWGY